MGKNQNSRRIHSSARDVCVLSEKNAPAIEASEVGALSAENSAPACEASEVGVRSEEKVAPAIEASEVGALSAENAAANLKVHLLHDLCADPWQVERAVRVDAQLLSRRCSRSENGLPVVRVEDLVRLGYSREISVVAIQEAMEVRRPSGVLVGARVFLLSNGRDVGVERLDSGEKGYALCASPARLRIGDVVRLRLASRWEVVL